MNHPYKPGDYVVRINQGTPRVKLGKMYCVQSCIHWDGRPRIRIIGEDGTTVTSCPSLYRPATEGEIMSHQNIPRAYAPSAPSAPSAPYPAPPMAPVFQPGTQVSVEEMRALADRVEAEQQAHEAAALAAKADREERQAIHDRINAHQDLAAATTNLLGHIRTLLVEKQPTTGSTAVLAKHRKALAGLAEAYGCKIVLVGDKTSATVVKV